jgi:hypothetical protein
MVARGAAPSDRLILADLNNDKRADYVVVDSAGALNAWLNNGMDVPGGNGWTSLGTIFTGIGIAEFWIMLADINADGAADYLLQVPNEGQRTAAWLNNGGDRP